MGLLTKKKTTKGMNLSELTKKKKEYVSVIRRIEKGIQPAILNPENDKLVEEALEQTIRAIDAVITIIDNQILKISEENIKNPKDKINLLKNHIKLAEEAKKSLIIALDPKKVLSISPLNSFLKYLEKSKF